MDSETLQKLTAFLAMPRGGDPYAEIRDVLCKTYEPKLEQKLDTLLASNDLGDNRPSEYMLELKRLLSNATTDDILKRIFVRSLPKAIRDSISRNPDDALDALVEAADKAWAMSVGDAAVSAVGAAASGQRSATGGGRGGRQRTPRPPKQDCKAVVLCHYHVKWGDAAKKCSPACSRWDPRVFKQQQQVFHVEQYDPEFQPDSGN